MNTATRVLVRLPADNYINALSEHPEATSINFQKARQQHAAYCEALITAGMAVEILEPLDAFPDSVFIEDNAVILNGRAVLCSMKEASRQGEISYLADTLQSRLPVLRLQAPVFIDGGDVLQTEDTLFVGQSQRTNKEAVTALQALTSKPVIPIAVKQGLHLKTSVSTLGKNLLVIHPSHIETEPFREFEWIEVDEEEAYAANCLALGEHVILPAGFPKLEQHIQERGFSTLPVDMSEFQKADGGVTCLSLLI
ncbi:MAG TPA: arginine deiminase family protein [Desulfobacteria bacterium]|nr:arginine deiminase family protein [Desulfobacteria bacterium]